MKPYIMLFLTEVLKDRKMNIKYFEDTDTALIEFLKNPISETKVISENIYIDLDAKGNLISMTIEHAKSSGSLKKLVYEEFKTA